jgi:hypothetical protein
MRISNLLIPYGLRRPAVLTIHRLDARPTTTRRVIGSPRIRFRPSGRPLSSRQGAERTGGLAMAAGVHPTQDIYL